jgi:hypothetical protein
MSEAEPEGPRRLPARVQGGAARMKRVLGWVLIVGFIAVTTAGIWLPPIITHAVE